jgi:diguanylate cyclase (GGDEF)-like protein
LQPQVRTRTADHAVWMSLPSTQLLALLRATLALAGTVAAVGFGAWPAATGCFAAVAAAAVLHARGAERQARRDPLTGVGNYRRLHERLHQAVSADPQRFAVLTLDVDQFKQINEEFGHLEGDRLLQEVGKALVDNVRGQDVVARQGGDEFSVLAPGTDEAGAAILAQRIERALASIEAADHAPVRASIGYAVFPRDGMTPQDLLEKADLELRRTKEQRRTVPAARADAADAVAVPAV